MTLWGMANAIIYRQCSECQSKNYSSSYQNGSRGIFIIFYSFALLGKRVYDYELAQHSSECRDKLCHNFALFLGFIMNQPNTKNEIIKLGVSRIAEIPEYQVQPVFRIENHARPGPRSVHRITAVKLKEKHGQCKTSI